MKRSGKWIIQHTVSGIWTMCFSSYKNCKLKVKLCWVGVRKRKRRAFFVTFVLSEGNSFNICVLTQSAVYWMNVWNIYTFTYQKTLLHTLLLLVFKIIESLQCILKLQKLTISKCSLFWNTSERLWRLQKCFSTKPNSMSYGLL